MSGIQMTPIRWPDRWDPAFMDRLIREVFAKADVRNANAGTGITITGTPDEVATISASQDIEDLLAGGPLTALDSGVDTARQIVAGDGSIIITDNGGGSTLEIAVGTIQLTQLGALPDLSVIGVPTADDGFDLPTSINALANDTVLRRVNDELDWGALTAGMFPDSTVSDWDSAEIDISTALFDLHGDVQTDGDIELLGGNDLVVYDSSGNDSLTINLDGTDALLTLASVAGFRMSGAAQLELAGGMDLWIRDAGFLRIYDAGDTDFGQFSHDGTYLHVAVTNTDEIRFAGANLYRFDASLFANVGDVEPAYDGVSANGRVMLWPWVTTGSGLVTTNSAAILGALPDFSNFGPLTIRGSSLYLHGDSGIALIGPASGDSTVGSSSSGSTARVSHNSGQPELFLSRSSGTVSQWENYLPAGSTALHWYNGADRMTLSAAGILVIGASGHAPYFQAINGAVGYAELRSGDTNPGYVAFHTPDSTRRGYLGYSNGASSLIFQSESGWGIVLASASGTVSVTGNLTASGDGTFNTSDRRYKRDIMRIDRALERVRKIRGYTFRKQVDGKWERKRRAAVIAQEIEEALPEAIIQNKDGYLLVSDASLSALFAEALNEAVDRIEALEAAA